MTITQENWVTYDDISQDFPTIAKLVDKMGSAVVMKDNLPRYVIVDFALIRGKETADNTEVRESARNLIARYLPAFQELAK